MENVTKELCFYPQRDSTYIDETSSYRIRFLKESANVYVKKHNKWKFLTCSPNVLGQLYSAMQNEIKTLKSITVNNSAKRISKTCGE